VLGGEQVPTKDMTNGRGCLVMRMSCLCCSGSLYRVRNTVSTCWVCPLGRILNSLQKLLAFTNSRLHVEEERMGEVRLYLDANDRRIARARLPTLAGALYFFAAERDASLGGRQVPSLITHMHLVSSG